MFRGITYLLPATYRYAIIITGIVSFYIIAPNSNPVRLITYDL
jgi:hypothetical protein